MGVRSGLEQKSWLEQRKEFTKLVQRVYSAWPIGVVIGLIGIQPTGFNAAGITLKFERPEVIQGFVVSDLPSLHLWGGRLSVCIPGINEQAGASRYSV